MTDATHKPILVIGGTGVFGRRLAEGLIRDGVPGVTIAGRSEARLREVARGLGCDWRVLDIEAPALAGVLSALTPLAVIDAAGPFQGYGGDPYRLARAALAAGAHYLDLSDDGGFTAGITALDAEARATGRAALSGVSSVPALSAAAVRSLSEGLEEIDLIDSMILPGNRAPRGRSVMAAILAQAGRPLPGSDRRGWIGADRVRIETGGAAFTRLASPIGAPDLLLMPGRFGAGDVRFRAGLELPLMHRGLGVMAWAVRLGLMRSALPFLPLVHPLAGMLERFGSDVGAMRVLVRGRTRDGAWLERVWTLVALAGDGPHVPAIPGRVLVRRLLAGDVAPGARPCLDEFTLAECEAAAPERELSFHREERHFRPLFEEVLGEAWVALPPEIRALHGVAGRRRWQGKAEVTRGSSLPARLIAWLFRFPPACAATPVTVTMMRVDDAEVWRRDFGGYGFRSRLTAGDAGQGRVWERFGPFSFAIDLKPSASGLAYPVAGGRVLGLPIPRRLLPRSDTSEAVDAEGRATFDVALSMPMIGRIVRYRGWLDEDQPISGDQELPVS